MHGFCDASQDAYGACIYLRSRLPGGVFRVELLCSKSRVAPLKAISLPRLELSAALLLAQLLERVCFSIGASEMRKVLWSDSTITLNWISSCSRRWTTFVSNRVGEIQRLTDVADWRHVLTGENPADLISRGVEPSALMSSSLWWHGPDYLLEGEALWPNFDFAKSADDLRDQRRVVLVAASPRELTFHEPIHRFSHIDKVARIAAYCMRFIRCLKLKVRGDSTFLGPGEVSNGLHTLCGDVQRSTFPDEIRQLTGAQGIDPRSRLLALSPFLDDDGLLRVGGRLKKSYTTRHPILLPKRHRLTDLIIRHEHVRNLHAGVQATIAAVRQRFWPLSVRSTTRRIVRDCVACFKANPSISEATMGELPAKRVEPSRPFAHCGVDYAGPIYIREGRRRNARHVKAYIAVFVCFAVKAVHLELIGDLTSEAFLGAFKRFIARRGKVVTIHSDNGTTFVGANRLLNELYEFYNSEPLRAKLRDFFRDSNVEWGFIPPNAPHFGGLWESAVKSAKHHMYRVIGNAHLTFEEMQTLLCEIEAILNSRPLTPLSEDPNDFSYLTPGHFLVGEALNSFPQPDLGDVQENRLSRWQRIEQLRQHFWQRWTRKYLTNLQERHKWKIPKGDQLKTGQLVLIKQPGLAPLQWLMGRVQQIHPRADGIARTATVRTTGGELVRSLARLAILPIEA
ncbi:uncharacterized protein LOC114882455 [Osmia bicornis bicornis]|uniref:uncharacterized protein LOC114882455 n=1 Tax=Osmia bicornis bicornis TaxID=1437191 RepID=UPI001EAF2364|nr:uncharacterized protein LOC114882455 [Osmia bicornis bicornis]